MTISGGYRVHEGRYRMPDLLNEEEMKLYFASTYGVGIDLRELTDEEREQIDSVGTVHMPAVIGDRERETILLRKQLGINSLEERVEAITTSERPPESSKGSESPTEKLDNLIGKSNK